MITIQVRIGYVSIAYGIYNNTPSSSFTYKLFKEKPRDEALKRAIEVGRKNLEATRRILFYNAALGIRLYRMSSALVPLATHPDVGINVIEHYGKELKEIGAFARKYDIRLSMHPNQFTLLNGTDKVVEAALKDLDYHCAILDGMEMDASNKVNIHIGGVYGNKESAIAKLYANMPKVSQRIRNRLTFENDDKTYSLQETLEVCEKLQQPMMLDLHHDWCNPSEQSPFDLLPRIQATWDGAPVKIHISSPKSEKEFRSHADYVDPEILLMFIKGCKSYGLKRLDVMVEAKNKDLACLKLAEDLSKVRGIKRIDGAMLEI